MGSIRIKTIAGKTVEVSQSEFVEAMVAFAHDFFDQYHSEMKIRNSAGIEYVVVPNSINNNKTVEE